LQQRLGTQPPEEADGVLFTSAGLRRDVVAINAAIGETLWMYCPDEGARAATGDFYGGHHHGGNLFSDALVCMEANTCRGIWGPGARRAN
jgi:hypothetical protein